MAQDNREARAAADGISRLSSPMTTRWKDNDPYGHLNNVVYYELFDAAVNQLLIARGLLDPATSPVIGLVVESRCRFFASLAFPGRARSRAWRWRRSAAPR